MISDPAVRVGVAAATNVSMFATLLVCEPFRVANRVSGKQLFDLSFHSFDGEPVRASNGFMIPVDGAISESKPFDIVVLVACFEVHKKEKDVLLGAVKRHARHGAMIWAVDHGVMLLAEAGMIGERRIAVHWELVPAVIERWPDLQISNELFVADGNLMTCCGHTACLDMTLSYIAGHHGERLAEAAANEMFWSRAYRVRGDMGEGEFVSEIPILKEAVEIMESNIEVPCPISRIARDVGVSCRQLEYLARKHFSETPQQRYLRIRLNRSRELLLHSSLSITEIAHACGFGSVSSFSRSFHRYFTSAPSTYRVRFRRELARPYIRFE